MLTRLITSIRSRFSRASATNPESGQAMMLTLAALALLAMVPLTIVATVNNQLPLTTSNLYYNSSYEAARAGLNNYLQQVDTSPTYVTYNTGNNNYDCSPGPAVNPAFCGFVAVPGYSSESYEYTVTYTSGAVYLIVSGKAGTTTSSVTRTFKYLIKPIQTTNYIYWTAQEVGYAGTTDVGSIVFDSNDTLNGPVFSNDDFHICGNPTFTSTVTSANSENLAASTNYWINGSGCSSTPNFEEGVPQLWTGTPNPQTISVNNLSPDASVAQSLGCYITTASSVNVTFSSNGSSLSWTGGTLDNLSSNPNTAATCGGASGGGTVTYSSLKEPLIYVSGNIVITNSSAAFTGFLTLVSNSNITLDGSITYPCSNITWQNTNGGCSSSSNPPTAPLADTTDALGLIALDSVSVNDSDAATTVDAAVLAIDYDFYNQAYTTACPSTGSGSSIKYNCPVLSVFGSIAQNYRGIVGQESSGQASNGYAKSYYYDNSFQTLSPPFFIPPSGADWVPDSYTECAPGPSQAALATPKC